MSVGWYLLVLAAIFSISAARVQPKNFNFLDMGTDSSEIDDVEKRYTSELIEELKSVSADALLLFTEYTSRASMDVKSFFKNITSLSEDTLTRMDPSVLNNAPDNCRKKFEDHLKKIQNDAYLSAAFNGEMHHKFLLGHMIVFRMHLNKSDEYVKKCIEIVKDCGIACESSPKIKKWRRLALDEIHRVRDDIEHSRRSYRDLLLHSRRRLNHIRKHANTRTSTTTKEFTDCVHSKHQ